MQSSCLEQFKYSENSIDRIDPVENDIKIPGAGEVYSVLISHDKKEIVAACFNGVYFGRIEGVNGNPDLYPFKWITNKVFFHGKVISAITQFDIRGKYLVAEFS